MPTLPIELFAQNTPAIKALLGELVQIESPTTDKAAVNRLSARLLPELQALGAQTQTFPNQATGDHLLCRWSQGPGGILLLCHMDTVYPLGTLAHQPFVEVDGKWLGPGVMDMKGGIVLLLIVLRLLRENALWPAGPITALFTSDEETGSHTSRQLIEDTARQAGLVLCLEPAFASGKLKTARKGTGVMELRVSGVAAHAGVDHAKGRNAIEALAHHILAAQQLTDYALGTTVNVGRVSGGTRNNVVPDEARATFDFRVPVIEEYQRLQSWAGGLQPAIEGTQVHANIALNRPPMPRDATMIQTFEKANAIAGRIGLSLTESSTGGGSDANFVAPLGIPVLDGLGPAGANAHAATEYAEIDSFAVQGALLAALLLEWI
jgi:glutamate carboxypeptidase